MLYSLHFQHFIMAMMVPKYVYRLTSQQGGHMNCMYKDKSYFVGFIFKEHPLHICKFISEDSNVEIAEYNTHHTSQLRIEKKININKQPLKVTYTEFAEFISMPLVTNTGAIMVYDVISDDPDEYLLDVQLFEGEFIPEAMASRFDKLIES